MDAIQVAIRMAGQGFMARLCDLERETNQIDPHLSGVLGKRFGAIATADWDITPAQVGGDEKADAEAIANDARQAIDGIAGFGDRIYDLSWGAFDGRAALETHWEHLTTVGGNFGKASGVALPQVRSRWVPASLGWIHPRRLSYGVHRELRLVDPDQAIGYYSAGSGWALGEFPGKFITWCPRLFGDYAEREGLGPRTVYWSFFKRFSWRLRMELTELFTQPWRVVEIDKDATYSPTARDDAEIAAQDLGSVNTAILERGFKLNVVQPQKDSHELYGMNSKEVNDELSKLVLGNVGTTDPDANRANSIIQKSEQDIIHQRDGRGVSEAIQRDLIRVFVLLNYGPNALHLTPKFQLRLQTPRDREKELARVKAVVSLGVPIAVAEVREVSGFRAPEPDEPYLTMGKGGTDAFGNPVPGAVTIVDPKAEPPPPGGPPPPSPGGAAEPPSAAAGDLADGPEQAGTDGAAAAALKDLLGLARGTGVNGSPEALVARGVKDGARETGRWAEALAAGVSGARSTEILRQLDAAGEALDVEKLARSIENRIVHALMLGALDADWEAENDDVVKPATFAGGAARPRFEPLCLYAIGPGGGVVDFVAMPFAEAIKAFASKEVITRRAFDRLRATAKRRAFTVAGMAKTSMLEVAKDELTKAITDGDDLRTFRGRLAERFESAGWTRLNPSHVETVFRNATMGAYSSGRHAQMTQPHVLAARPYWQILGVKDARSRETHAAAHGKVFSATDPGANRLRAPFGHQCRCRIVSRSARDIERLGLQVVAAAAIRGIPDDGWDPSEGAID